MIGQNLTLVVNLCLSVGCHCSLCRSLAVLGVCCKLAVRDMLQVSRLHAVVQAGGRHQMLLR